MERIEKIIQRDCEILGVGDTHEDIMMHEKGLLKHVDYVIKRPDSRYLIHMGDWIEAIPTDDKRYQYNPESCPLPKKQADHIIDIFKPVASQMIVGLLGNHERKHHRIMNFAEYICNSLGIPYGTGMCRIVFRDPSGARLFNFLVTHGRWNFTSNAKDYEQQQANMKAMLRMKLGALRFGDCIVQMCGHAHKILISPPARQLFLNDKQTQGKATKEQGISQHYYKVDQTAAFIPHDERWYVCTGSYRKNMVDGVDDYAEGYGPVELGCVKIIVSNGEVASIEPMKL